MYLSEITPIGKFLAMRYGLDLDFPILKALNYLLR